VAIYCCDFAATVATADRGDFVYFDPPYIPATATSSFTTYTANGFGMAEHVRLRDLADDLRRRDVEVLLSNSDTPTTRDLYKGWDFVEVRRRGIISCKGDGRQPVGELLIRSRTAPNATGIASKRRRTISRSGAAQG
jgi:DNA adenine methylase